MLKRFVGRRCWLMGIAVLAGCGGSGIQFAQVEGKLLVDGSPVDKIQIEFVPLGEGPHSIGITDGEGKFKLTTLDGNRSGAVVGKSRVALIDVGIMGDKFLGRAGEEVDMSQGRTPRVSDKYRDPVKSPLEKEVTAGKCVIDLEVTAK